jgi:hypothetical protein
VGTARLESLLPLFPKLTRTNYRETSDATDDYNCIAHAAGFNNDIWWPDEDYFWPPECCPPQESVDCVEAMFQARGYERCADGSRELGYVKVAIYAKPSGKLTHAAIQPIDRNGWWKSKLGIDIDIEHDLSALDGPEYGTAVRFLRMQVGRTNQRKAKKMSGSDKAKVGNKPVSLAPLTRDQALSAALRVKPADVRKLLEAEKKAPKKRKGK